MTNYQLKNSTDKPIKILVNGASTIMQPGSVITDPDLANAEIKTLVPVDVTLRQRRVVSEKFSKVSRVHKEAQNKVNNIQLPELFVILKIKKAYNGDDQ